MKKNIFSLILVLSIVAGFASSCSKDYLNTEPTSSLTEATIFANTENAMMAVNGIHRLMHEGGKSGTTTTWVSQGGYPCFCMHLAVMGDDVIYTFKHNQHYESQAWAHHRDLTHKYYDPRYYWKFFYRINSNANKILLYIDDIPGSDAYRNFVKGQALAYRAFANFQLVQAWAERYDPSKTNSQPGIILRTSVDDPAQMARASVEDTYAQILADLEEAVKCLENTSVVKKNKSHIDQWVAKGLKARVLLTMGKWAEAAAVAEDVAEHSGAKLQADTYTTLDYRNSSMANTEWLWGLNNLEATDAAQYNQTKEWHHFFANTASAVNKATPRVINNLLYKTIPSTDVRSKIWVEDPYTNKADVIVPGSGKYAPYMSQKWIIPTSTDGYACADVAYMRLPEILLIEAEGYARANQTAKAEAALLKLAQHRDPAYTIANGAVANGEEKTLINKIMWQRRVELWAECGLRWFDLKRLDLPCDRGPRPREGYNQGGTANGWGNAAKMVPWNNTAVAPVDPLASNYNMYGEQIVGWSAVYIEKPSLNKQWQWLIPVEELNSNALCVQND